jgi:serine phosphatase RsbU (regulator of sigma subunit)
MTVTKKLLLINSLICAAFVVVIMVVFFSFRHVEKVLTTTFASETRRIIENSNMTRELSRVLSDMNLVVSTFYEKSEVLKTQGLRLFRGTQSLLTKSGDEELNASLNRFIQQINDILRQCEQVNLIREEIGEIEKNFDHKLISLDDIIAERLVELMAEGGDTSDLEQLSTMIGGWRESFIRIKLQFVQLGLEYFKRPLKEADHPLLTAADDLLLRLRTLTAATPAIAEHGRSLMHLLTEYKASVFKFHRSAENLRILLEKNKYEKEVLLSMMAKTDAQIGKKTEEATEALTGRIRRSVSINLIIFLGILPIVILGGITAYSIKKPVQTVIEYIERLSKGDIPEPIHDEYRGEFSLVRDYVNILITATRRVTQVAEHIASGDMDIIVRERSENDRLMQALNRMIQRLNDIMNETGAMIQAVGMGKLDIRGNAENYEGGWRELITGINDLIQGLSNAVSKSAALGQEMELARKIQTSLLPTLTDSMHPDFEIAAAMIPADQVGGDFYDIMPDRSGHLWLAVGDVSGHGVTPGLIMMMAQTVHATVTTNLECDARSVVVKINEILYMNVHERLKERHFMTFTALKYLGEGRFQYAGAHLSMIVFRKKTGDCELIRTEGVYLNFKKDISRATKNNEFLLNPGDTLVLYTDGITEAEHPDGKMLDIDGFLKIVEKHAHRNPEAMKEMIMADVIKWCDDRRADDMTLVIVRRKSV